MSTIATEFDEESDLTSLEDEDEQHLNGSATNKTEGILYESESSLTSEYEDESEISYPDSQEIESRHAISGPKLSPSRIGTSLSRPAPVVGLRTYGRRRERLAPSIKQATTPKTSPSPERGRSLSPLTPSPSPPPQKRRASESARQLLGSPSKRQRKRSGFKTDSIHKPDQNPASRRKGAANGHDSSLDSRSRVLPTKQENGKRAAKSKGDGSSVSAVRRPRLSLPTNPKSPGEKASKPQKPSLETLDTLVWVRVNRKNVVVYGDSTESFWWPAMMEPAKDRGKSIKVRLLFPPSGASTSLSINVERRSPSNIVSYKNHSYTANSFWHLPSSSARSRPAGFEELKSRWESACNKIVEEDLRLHDGFPTSLTALLSQPLMISNNAHDESASRAASPEQNDAPPIITEEEPWSPPPPDSSITIPGEYVLATTKTKGYWGKFYPAKVIAYVPPSKPSVPPRYTVHFMDNFHEDVTRDMFYTYEQDEFGTCKLGEFESLESLEEKDTEDNLNRDGSVKPMEPISFPDSPSLPAPLPEEFCELSMREQISYIIPILTRVIENDYKPAEERVSAFLRGGRGRREDSKKVQGKGLLTNSEFNELANIIKRWAMGLDASSNGTTGGTSDTQQADAHVLCEQAPPSRSDAPDVAQEIASSPDGQLVKEILCQTSDKEPPPSLPPSSLPPSSVPDEAPSSSPNGVGGGGDQDTTVDESTDEAKLNKDDHPIINGIQPITVEQPKLPTMPSFKDLPSLEKIHFCTEVLLKEAVIQLLLWRAGRRRSPELLSDTEELLLHESGSNLAGEFDIALTVRDLRQKKEKSLQARLSSKQGVSTNSTRSTRRKI